MQSIVDVHFPGIKKQLLNDALASFFQLREVPGLKKKPSTSELLDWLKLLLAEDIPPEKLREAVRAVRVEPSIREYITKVVRATRDAASLTLGASPRGGVALLRTSQALAFLGDRDFVIPDDVKTLAPAVLRHRVTVAPELELEGVTPDRALQAVLEQIEAPTT